MANTSKNTMSVTTRLILGGSVLLCLAGLAAFWYASGKARQRLPHADAQQVTVTIRDKICDPADITVPAGRTTFTIVNQTQRALEWEILDGVMVVDERENIAPGFSQTLTVKLRPGTFAITCGLLSNPRGTLTVTPSQQSEAEDARPPMTEYIGPLAEYRVYMVLTAKAVQTSAGALRDAIAQGDITAANKALLDAHQAYKRLEPMAELFADLDTRLNARPEYYALREQDPAFSGFYRLRYLLMQPQDPAAMQSALTSLLDDTSTLGARVRNLSIAPERLAQAGARTLRRAADHLESDKASTSDAGHNAPSAQRYLANDLALVHGTRDGARKLYALLSPLLERANPDLHTSIVKDFETLDQTLAATPANPAEVTRSLRALAENFSKINAALGLE